MSLLVMGGKTYDTHLEIVPDRATHGASLWLQGPIRTPRLTQISRATAATLAPVARSSRARARFTLAVRGRPGRRFPGRGARFARATDGVRRSDVLRFRPSTSGPLQDDPFVSPEGILCRPSTGRPAGASRTRWNGRPRRIGGACKPAIGN